MEPRLLARSSLRSPLPSVVTATSSTDQVPSHPRPPPSATLPVFPGRATARAFSLQEPTDPASCPPTTTSMPPASDRPKKLQRISQACDLCHRRSIRCRPSAEEPQTKCQNCHDFAVDCTYNRPSRRRRNPSERQVSPGNLQPGLQQYPQRSHEKSQQTKFASPSGGAHEAAPVHPELSHYTVSSQGMLDLTGAYTLIRDNRSHDVLETAWRSFALASASAIKEYLQIYMEVIYPVYPVRIIDS
nr:putative transcriptional regulatory protein c16g5.16 [Quercus suber]